MYAKRPFVGAQWFGASISLATSISLWLIIAAVAHCSTVSDDVLGPRFQCKQDSLGAYLIAYQRWPYDHAPFIGYWDSYDNKLAALVEEPYSKLFLMTAMAYLAWFRIVIFARNRHARKKVKSMNR